MEYIGNSMPVQGHVSYKKKGNDTSLTLTCGLIGQAKNRNKTSRASCDLAHMSTLGYDRSTRSTNRDADQANPNCQPYYKSFSPGLTPAAAAALEVEARRFRHPPAASPTLTAGLLPPPPWGESPPSRSGVLHPCSLFRGVPSPYRSLYFLALMRRFRCVACDLASFLL